MKKILTIGGAGVIGSHLCEYLLYAGHEVICLDNFYSGSKQNIASLINNPRFELIRHDVTNPFSIECDEIYNLACPASPVFYQRDPVKTINTSVMGAIHSLELAKRLKCPVLLTSTSEIYGDPLVHPQYETYNGNVNTTSIRACYDEGKRCAETLFMDYYRQYDVDIRIARIFNTYGPRLAVNDGRVISNFIVQALKGDDITIYGDGTQTRSFMYVSDCVEGLVKLMDSDWHRPINIGNPDERSMLEIARIIAELTERDPKIVFKPLPSDDPLRRMPDITLAEKRIKWHPKVSLEEGLKLTIEYFKNHV
jgi:UDP-glucuronate decarboxylase